MWNSEMLLRTFPHTLDNNNLLKHMILTSVVEMNDLLSQFPVLFMEVSVRKTPG